jgi:hypothetical protein
MNLNRKEKEKDFSNPSSRQVETLHGPAHTGVLSLLDLSHSAGHDWYCSTQRQPCRPTRRGIAARPEQRERTLDAVVVRSTTSDRQPVNDEVFTVVPHDPRRVRLARCDALALTAHGERRRRAVYRQQMRDTMAVVASEG